MTYIKAAALVLSVAAVASFSACSKRPAGTSGSPPAQQPGTTATAAPVPGGDPSLAASHAAEPAPDLTAAPATSIADVWANRKALAGKAVTVHGKVVKYNGGILGRNWVHVQDGTGKPQDHTNDLTITTSDETQVGDEITATGVVGIDRDFTAGYQYPVMLENARLLKK